MSCDDSTQELKTINTLMILLITGNQYVKLIHSNKFATQFFSIPMIFASFFFVFKGWTEYFFRLLYNRN